MFEGDLLDHVTTALIGWHRLKVCHFAIRNANACRRKHFVAAKYIKVAIDLLYVGPKMRRSLRTINNRNCSMCMSNARDHADGIDCPKHIRDRSEEHTSELQ